MTAAATRRSILGGAGAASVLPGIAAAGVAPLGPDAELLRQVADLQALGRVLDRWNADDGMPWHEGEAANSRWCDLVRQIAGTPAHSAADLRAKAEAAQSVRRLLGGRDLEHELAASLARDVLGAAA